MPRFALLKNEKGLALNFYESGEMSTKTPAGKALTITQSTAYPTQGKVKITLTLENSESFELSLRIPAWCKNATVTVDGETSSAAAGYYTASKEWKNGDVIELDLPMDVQRILPPEGADNQDVFAAYRRGPMVLAADARLVDPATVIDIVCDDDGIAEHRMVGCPEIRDSLECVELETRSGEKVRLVDYSSAGKTWAKDSSCSAWLYLKNID